MVTFMSPIIIIREFRYFPNEYTLLSWSTYFYNYGSNKLATTQELLYNHACIFRYVYTDFYYDFHFIVLMYIHSFA